jgi:hypothetical protein
MSDANLVVPSVAPAGAPVVSQIGRAAVPDGLVPVTSPLYPSQTLSWRLRSLPPQTYDLRLSSHVMRIASVLLGETGPEQLAKRAMYDRFRETMAGANFLDLDSFWGLIFALDRSNTEVLQNNLNPYTDVVTSATWQAAHDADSSYRDRIFQFAQGVQAGPSRPGIQAVCEAVLGTPCEVFEHYAYTNTPYYSSFPGETLTGQAPLYEVTVIPHTSVNMGDLYSLTTILDTLKPADTIISVRQMGLGAFTPVPLTQAFASSSYWEVERNITTVSGSPYSSGTVGRWAFSGSQGDSWSLVASVVASTSAAYSPDTGGMLASSDYQHQVWLDGTSTDYTPDQALMLPWEAETGRLAQSGVMSANPINPSSAPSPVTVDGIDLGEYATALQALGPRVGGSGHTYWASVQRVDTDDTIEVATWTLDGPHLITNISMQVANLPHQMTFCHLDAATGTWLVDAAQTILPNAQTVYPAPWAALAAKTNPALSGPGAWQTIGFTLAVPVTTTAFRVTLQRVVSVNAPVDLDGVAVPYPLAVASLNVGSVITDRSALPVAGSQIDTGYTIFGDQVSFDVYDLPPSGPLAASPTTWRCSPQPSPLAVVNYYLDCRSASSTPQVIDGLWVAPTQAGVTATLYATADEPSGPASAVSVPLPVTTAGTVEVTTAGLSFSSVTPSSVAVAAGALRFSGGDWWFGATWLTALQQVYTVITCGPAVLSVAAGVVTLTTPEGTVSVAAPVGPQSLVGVVGASLSGQNAATGLQGASGMTLGSYTSTVVSSGAPFLYLAVMVDGLIYAASTAVSFPPPLSGAGVSVGATTGAAAGIVVTDLVIKGATLSATDVVNFGAAPASVTFPAVLQGGDASASDGAWLRFNNGWVSSANPLGFVGGTPDVTPLVNWTPLLVSTTLTTGYLRFAPICPTFIKIEMTNLVPELSPTWTPDLATVNVMAPSAVTPAPPSVSSTGALPPGVATAIGFGSGESAFRASVPPPTVLPSTGSISPTQALISQDPATATALADAYLPFGYTDWHQPSPSGSSVSSPGVENYSTETVLTATQIGYYCGFREIRAVRSTAEAPIDFDIFDETFADTAFFGPVSVLASGS